MFVTSRRVCIQGVIATLLWHTAMLALSTQAYAYIVCITGLYDTYDSVMYVTSRYNTPMAYSNACTVNRIFLHVSN